MVLLEVDSLLFFIMIFGMLCMLESILPTRYKSLRLNEYDFGITYVTTGIFLFLLLSLTNLYSLMRANITITQCLIFIGLHLIVGGMWSFFQWYMLMKDTKQYFIEFRDNWLKSKNYTLEDIRTLVDKKKQWEDHRNDYCKELPTWKRYRHIITLWVIYWPILMFDFALSYLLYDLVQYVVSVFSSFYEMIYKKVFKDVEGL